eukprot:9644613-Prorocentrum_lima.AAC.1
MSRTHGSVVQANTFAASPHPTVGEHVFAVPAAPGFGSPTQIGFQRQGDFPRQNENQFAF